MLTATRPAHDLIAHALSARGKPFTDHGAAGFYVPDLSPFAMDDREAVRWLADLGVVL